MSHQNIQNRIERIKAELNKSHAILSQFESGEVPINDKISAAARAATQAAINAANASSANGWNDPEAKAAIEAANAAFKAKLAASQSSLNNNKCFSGTVDSTFVDSLYNNMKSCIKSLDVDAGDIDFEITTGRDGHTAAKNVLKKIAINKQYELYKPSIKVGGYEERVPDTEKPVKELLPNKATVWQLKVGEPTSPFIEIKMISVFNGTKNVLRFSKVKNPEVQVGGKINGEQTVYVFGLKLLDTPVTTIQSVNNTRKNNNTLAKAKAAAEAAAAEAAAAIEARLAEAEAKLAEAEAEAKRLEEASKAAEEAAAAAAEKERVAKEAEAAAEEARIAKEAEKKAASNAAEAARVAEEVRLAKEAEAKAASNAEEAKAAAEEAEAKAAEAAAESLKQAEALQQQAQALQQQVQALEQAQAEQSQAEQSQSQVEKTGLERRKGWNAAAAQQIALMPQPSLQNSLMEARAKRYSTNPMVLSTVKPVKSSREANAYSKHLARTAKAVRGIQNRAGTDPLTHRARLAKPPTLPIRGGKRRYKTRKIRR